MAESNPLSPGTPPPSSLREAAFYAFLSFISLAICLLIGWYIVTDRSIASSTIAFVQGYYVLLAVLALSAASFLFGALRSSARLTGNQYGYAVDLGGPVVIAVLVVVGGYLFTKQPEEFSFYIRLKSDGPITNAENSSVVVDFGMRREERKFSSDGEAIFSSIAARSRNALVRLSLKSDLFVLKNDQETYSIPDGMVLYLGVTRMPHPRLQPCSEAQVVNMHNAGWAAFQDRKFDVVERIARQLFECNKADFSGFNLLGSVAFFRQQYDRSVDLFQKAVDAAPERLGLKVNLADAWVEWGLHSNADNRVDRLQKALKIYESMNHSSSTMDYKVARVQFLLGEDQAAAALLKPIPTSYDDDGGRGKARILEGAIYIQMAKADAVKMEEYLSKAKALFLEGARADISFWRDIFFYSKVNYPEPFDALQDAYGDKARIWLKELQ